MTHRRTHRHRVSTPGVLLTACLLCAGVVRAVGGQAVQSLPQPTRDSANVVPVGTAEVSGILLTDDQAQQPVHRAKIVLGGLDSATSLTAYTDNAGTFKIQSVPAGRYTLMATKPAYVRAAYGAKRFDRPGTPITVATGQRVTDLILRMAHGGVITGSVTDASGQPAPGVSVQVMQYRNQNGERTLLPALFSGGSPTGTTDDRGVYRIYGLAAGEYLVSASPLNTGSGDIREMTPAVIQAAQQTLQQSGPATPSQAATSGADAVTVGFAPVFFPGTTNPASAVTVTIGAGEERAGIDVAIQLVHTARVEGVVVTPGGVPPQNVQLLLMPSDGASGGLMMQMTSPDATGKFSYTGVRPGSYTINATSRTMNAGGDNAPRGGGAGASAAALPLWATADVNVNGQPVTGVTLNLQPGMTIGGSVVVSAVNADPPADLSRARVSLTPATSGGIMMNVPNAQVGADGKFSLTGITPGKYRVSASLSSPEANWTPKSAVVKGKDALDFPLEVLPNQELGDLVVTFTNQTQEVSGALQDASGRPAPDFTIVIFPADKALWTATRRIKTARPGTDGRFILANLPMGDYRLAAVTDLAPGDQNDPAFLEQLVSASVAIALKDGEKRIQDLKIGGQ